MRLPWWPIYVDARLDEQGVHFSHPQFPIDFVPWQLVGYRGQYLVCYLPDGKLIRAKNAPLFLRVGRASKKEVSSLQQSYFNDPANSYSCGIDLDIYARSVRASLGIQLTFTVLLPLLAFLGMVHGYRTVPLNDSGVRYQNGIIFGCIVLVLLVIAIQWRVWRSIRSFHRAKKIVSVDQDGFTAQDDESTKTHYPWDEIQRFKPGLMWYHIIMRSGEQVVIPQKAHAWSIVRLRSRTEPTSIRMSIFYPSLILAILFGPLMWGWFAYLLPDEPLPPHRPLVVSVFATFQVLFFTSFMRIATFLEKRKLAKSVE